MGGSLAMCLRGQGLCREVRGVARRGATVVEAISRGVVDQATTDLAAGVAGADIVVLAAPVRVIIDLIPQLGPLLKPGALVTDMGSTKTDICRVLATLPQGVEPVGGHPMCGKETSGLDVAEADLYRDKTWVLSPLERTSPPAVALAECLVKACGARPLYLEPERHDRLVAAISHLPYLLAVALVSNTLNISRHDSTVWDVAASGFRDTSRLAASDVRMILDILLTNRSAIRHMLDGVRAELETLDRLLDGDPEALSAHLETVRKARTHWQYGERNKNTES